MTTEPTTVSKTGCGVADASHLSEDVGEGKGRCLFCGENSCWKSGTTAWFDESEGEPAVA